MSYEQKFWLHQPAPHLKEHHETAPFATPAVSDTMAATPERPMRLLLIDDDRTYGQIVARTGTMQGAEVTTCATLEELSQVVGRSFDVALVDYDLGAVNGFELANYLENHLDGAIPIILISVHDSRVGRHLPRSVFSFVSKSRGPMAVLEEALRAAHSAKKGRK